MKSIEKYLSELPEPFNEMALEEHKRRIPDFDLMFPQPEFFNRPSDAVLYGFEWDSTELGVAFWIGVHSELLYLEKK